MSKLQVNSPRAPYIGIPGNTLLAHLVTGLNASTKQQFAIGGEVTELAHDCGTDDGDTWKGDSAVFGSIALRADAGGWIATIAMFPDVTVRLTESNACARKRCPFPLLGAILIDGIPEVVSVRQVIGGQAVACEGGACKR